MNIKAKTKTVNISDIKPYPNNAKIHSPEQIDQLKKSIKKYGMTQPIAVDKNNICVIGHGRLEAIKALNHTKKIEVIDLSHIKSKEIKKLRILDNKIVSNEWNNEFLKSEIDSLFNDFNDIDKITEDLGMSEKELNSILGPRETKGDDDLSADIKPITQMGDLWELGNHRLLCGDATIITDVEKLMDGKKADIVFTDPPYGVAIGDKNKLLDGIEKAERIKENFKNDTLEPEELKEQLKSAFILLKKYSNDVCSYFVTAPQGGGLGMMMMMMMCESGLPVRHVIIWVKNKQCFSFGRLDYEYKHEPILYTWNKSHKFYGNGLMKSSIWEVPKENKCDKHPTMKPVMLIENALLNNSIKDNICVDIFAGSGSTLIACEKTQRICYAMEIDPHYCDVTRDRYIDFCKKNDIPIKIKLNGKEWYQKTGRKQARKNGCKD